MLCRRILTAERYKGSTRAEELKVVASLLFRGREVTVDSTWQSILPTLTQMSNALINKIGDLGPRVKAL